MRVEQEESSLPTTNAQNYNNSTSDSESSIIVVGAGPAGASAAYYLALAGIKVTVLDESVFPREKICGDFVSPGSIVELQRIGVADLAAFKRSNVIDRATIYVGGKELVAGGFPSVRDLPNFSRIIRRNLLDSLVLGAARKAGARFIEGFRVTDYKVDAEGVTITATGSKGLQTFRASLLIGADGNNSIIARNLRGSAWPEAESAIVARGYFEEVSGNPNEANVFYDKDSFPGYSWLFPTCKHEANVGIGIVLGANPPAENPIDLLKKFISNDEGMRSRLEHAKLKGEIQVSQLNLHDPKMPLVGDRVMLVGEAAGLINPYNGEGIQFGLKSGRWAAETVIALKGDYSEEALSAYSKRVGDELDYGFKVSELLLKLLRNRNLNYAWLRWIELMGEKSKIDPHYARLTSAILSGMIFPDQEEANETLIGTLQEAALSVGVKTFSEVLNEPSKVPQAAISLAQTGFEIVRYAAQDPFSALLWGLNAATKVLEVSAEAAEKAVKVAANDQTRKQQQ